MKLIPHGPETLGELWDKLGSMMLGSPTFKDSFFENRSVETEFFSLNEGLSKLRKKFGEERYAKMMELSDRMRAHFEADPEDENGEANMGRELILQMEDIIREVRRGKRPAPSA